MAGHSHWAGIKHKKGKVDKERSKLFSCRSTKDVLSSKDSKSEELLLFVILEQLNNKRHQNVLRIIFFKFENIGIANHLIIKI